jgi:abortive infection bacteriophage resistance protein
MITDPPRLYRKARATRWVFFFGGKMQKYNKAPTTYADQVAILQKRGLIVGSPDVAVKFFQQVNYYRFSAYCIPFQHPHDVFIPGTTFERIVELYHLDEELRIALLALLSPIEIYFRTQIIYELSHARGAFAYYDSANFYDASKHKEWTDSLAEEVNRGKEAFLEHYKATYEGFPCLPLWMACEVMSVGSLSLLYRNLTRDLQKKAYPACGVSYVVLPNWMHVITYLRNTCAHHSRLWNRILAIQPLIPGITQWQALNPDNHYLFATVAMAEWICVNAQLPICKVQPVYDVMRRISAIDPRFAGMMGVPFGKTIGMCWDK